jgi:hypothetical protein
MAYNEEQVKRRLDVWVTFASKAVSLSALLARFPS